MILWPEIRRIWLSSDITEYTPEQTHYQIYLGGYIPDNDLGRFMVWTEAQLKELDRDLDLTSFHWLILRRSARKMGSVVEVQCFGGPFDGELFRFTGIQPPASFNIGDHVYGLVASSRGPEYKYKAPD
jgi:hypothetical protein